jgi:RNA polymerase sigma-70 factor (ECF subfamily)
MESEDSRQSAPLEPTDEELMLAFQQGDDLACDALYRRYKTPLLLALTRRTRGNRAIAEDLYDDTFCRLIEKKLTFDPSKGCFRAWLYKIALNNYRGLYRSTEIFFRSMAVGLSEKLPAPLVEAMSVDALLKDLPGRERQVMELIVSGEFTLAQVAEIMAIPVERVYRLRYEALKRLRKRYGAPQVQSALNIRTSKTE